jgi:hypothetical protein
MADEKQKNTSKTLYRPTEDIIFKLLMTRPDSLEFLSFFLDNLFPSLSGSVFSVSNAKNYETLDKALEQIDFELRPNEELPSDAFGMGQRVDVHCQHKNGDNYIIEMQAKAIPGDNLDNKHINLITRDLFYLARLFGNQKLSKNKKEKYKLHSNLSKTILVNITGFDLFPNRPNFINTANIRFEDGYLVSDYVSFTFFELLKTKKYLKKPINEIEPLQGIAFFLQFASDNRYKDLIKNLGDKWKEIKVAHEALQQIKDEVPEKRLQELISLRHQMDSEHFKAVYYYEGKAEGIAEGKAEGKAEGIAEGKAEGKAEGIAEGKAEGIAEGAKKEKLKNAKNMLDLGFSIDAIKQVTDLSKKEILSLQKK